MFPSGSFPVSAFPQASFPPGLAAVSQGGYQTPVAGWPRSASSGTKQAGYNSPVAAWLGSASSARVITEQGGYRSVLAYWIGGAAAVSTAPRPGPQPGGGDSRRQEWLRLKAQIKQEDEEIAEIIATLIENDIIH